MSDTKKLYRVVCRGMTTGYDNNHGIAYVVAKNPNEAYATLRATLDAHDVGFRTDRELDRVELLADAAEYPDCRCRLLLAEDQR